MSKILKGLHTLNQITTENGLELKGCPSKIFESPLKALIK